MSSSDAPSKQVGEFKIEKGIPLSKVNLSRPFRYPWAQMEVGDSFIFQGERKNIATVAHAYGRRHNIKFATRNMPDGVRVWRIA